MKKNQIILIGVLSSLLLLFFMLVYKSDKEYEFTGDSVISISVQTGSQLKDPNSLINLLGVYTAKEGEDPKPYTQTKILMCSDAGEEEISSEATGMPKFRSFFNSKFYVYDDRVEDLKNLNSEDFTSAFALTKSNPDLGADIVIKVTNGEPELTYIQLKDSISALLNNGQAREISISFVSGSSNDQGLEGEKNVVKKVDKKTDNSGSEDEISIITEESKPENKPEPKQDNSCSKNNVSTSSISFQPGLPNTFSWTEDDGMTYDFTLKCSQGDCASALSVSKSNVSGGQVRVNASFDESTDKRYIATLTIKCGGKVLKTITKIVSISCS